MITQEFFLDPKNIYEQCAYAGVSAPDQAALLALATRICAQSSMLALAQQLYHDTYVAPEWVEEAPPTPVLEAAFGVDASALYVLVGLDCVRLIRAAQAKRGVPESITRASCDSPAVGLRRFRKLYGQVGMDRWTLVWFRYLAGGDLYRLGRLQFIPEPCQANIVVYRHNTSGRVQALAAPGMRFAGDGFPPADDAELPAQGWVSELRETTSDVTGTPLSACGMALPQPMSLRLSEWLRVLGNGDTVLSMHIPDLDSIALDVLRDSFEQAMAFFPRYYPDQIFNAFVCESWMFNTQLQDMLPASSKLVQFQIQGYRTPHPPVPEYSLYFIFGRKHIDLATAPRDTTLRRAVLAHLKAGQTLRNGGWFLLREDALQFGKQPYADDTTS